MIIDPQRNGVYIWTDSNVTSIKGEDVYKICNEIYSRVVIPRETLSGNLVYDQIYELYIDIGGMGMRYKDCLTDMGLDIHDIRYRNIDTVLPVRCHNVNKWNTKKEYDIKPTFW